MDPPEQNKNLYDVNKNWKQSYLESCEYMGGHDEIIPPDVLDQFHISVAGYFLSLCFLAGIVEEWKKMKNFTKSCNW